MPLSVVQTSVFADGPNGGNPCPIVLEAGSLTAEQMRSLAATWNQESGFVRQIDSPENCVRLRYFVPNHEMEMCGHATIASVIVLVELGLVTPGEVAIDTELGRVEAQCEIHDGMPRVIVDQFKPEFHDNNPTVPEVASALDISQDDIDKNLGPIVSVSTSRHKLMIPLRDPSVLNGLDPNFEALWNLCDEYRTTGFYPFAISEDKSVDIESRQFPNRAGYEEDSATGVAACAAAAYLRQYDVLDTKAAGVHTIYIAQGRAMGQPSLLEARTEVRGGSIVKTQVAGSATIDERETVTVP